MTVTGKAKNRSFRNNHGCLIGSLFDCPDSACFYINSPSHYHVCTSWVALGWGDCVSGARRRFCSRGESRDRADGQNIYTHSYGGDLRCITERIHH